VFLFKGLLTWVLENPTMPKNKKSFSFLYNFAKVIVNRHAILSWSTDIDSAILEIITTLTFKNDVDLRLAMKDVKLFELRDMLLINLIRLCDEEEYLLKLLTKFSFESICNQQSFKDSLALANLVRALVRTKNEDLQIFILKLFKFELVNEECQKEVARLANDQQIITFLFPNLKPKLLNLPCFTSEKLKDKPESSEAMSQSVEVFLKIFNTDHYSDIKKKIELTCQGSLLEMQKSARVNKTKVVRANPGLGVAAGIEEQGVRADEGLRREPGEGKERPAGRALERKHQVR